jgi:hypothetical protein
MAVRAQAALEYILIVGLVMAILVPFTYYGYISSQESTRVLQANRAVESLADAAKYVYSQGVGSRVTVEVVVPDGVNFPGSYIGKPAGSNASVPSKEINLRVETQSGETDVFKSVDFDVRGSWLSHSGQYLFVLYMTDDGYVMIVPYNMDFDALPSYFSYSIARSTVQQFNFTVVSYSETTQVINFSEDGVVTDWIALSNSSITLGAGESAVITGTISVPADAAYGLNFGSILASSANTSKEILFDVNVYSDVGGCNSVRAFIDFYHNSSYSANDYIFPKGDPVIVYSTGWRPVETVTVDIKNPSNASVSGYPQNVSANATGGVYHSWSAANAAEGLYVVSLNNSRKTRSVQVNITQC